jgi:hypothetical protein
MYMTREKKAGTIVLLGMAAYALYRYSRMNADDKMKLADDIKNTGKKLLDQFIPEPIQSKLTGIVDNMTGINKAEKNTA